MSSFGARGAAGFAKLSIIQAGVLSANRRLNTKHHSGKSCPLAPQFHGPIQNKGT